MAAHPQTILDKLAARRAQPIGGAAEPHVASGLQSDIQSNVLYNEVELKDSHSTAGRPGLTSSLEDRALELLSFGEISQEQVASHLGVHPSRISQLMSDEKFAEKVAAARFHNLQQHNTRDSKYDSLEDTILRQLENSIVSVYDPMKLSKVLSVVNGAKRRGATLPTSINQRSQVTELSLPSVLVNRFSVNVNNQVINVSQSSASPQDKDIEKSLVTIQSSTLLKQTQAEMEVRQAGHLILPPAGTQTQDNIRKEISDELTNPATLVDRQGRQI